MSSWLARGRMCTLCNTYVYSMCVLWWYVWTVQYMYGIGCVLPHPCELYVYSVCVEQGNHMRGLPFNLTMYWNVMPITGGLDTQKRTFTGFQIPGNYSKRSPYTHQDW